MKGKVAIVTGGGGGLGSEICRRFASRGAAVAVVDMNTDAAGQVASDINSGGGRAYGGPGRGHRRGVGGERRARQSWKGLAGWTTSSTAPAPTSRLPILDMSLEQWDISLEAHLTGAFLFCREAGRRMVEQGDGGSIVLMSSVAATAPVPERGAYGPAKAGPDQLRRTARLGVGAVRYQRQRRLSGRRSDTDDQDGLRARAGAQGSAS